MMPPAIVAPEIDTESNNGVTRKINTPIAIQTIPINNVAPSNRRSELDRGFELSLSRIICAKKIARGGRTGRIYRGCLPIESV